MIETWAKQLGAVIESSTPISYGTQYRLFRGSEKAIVNVYRGKGGTKYVVQQNSPLADELREIVSDRKTDASATWSVWCGTDESGKGDFFGPLAVAGVLLTAEDAVELGRLGVRDSKTMSNATAVDLDKMIRKTAPFHVVCWMPAEYNRRYADAGNVNRLLGEMHAQAIDVLAGTRNDVEAAVTDQFGDESYVRSALKTRMKLVQRPRADETDVAVAAASVVARVAFLRGIAELVRKFGMGFPLGAGPDVDKAGKEFVRKHGRDALGRAAKVHFKTATRL